MSNCLHDLFYNSRCFLKQSDFSNAHCICHSWLVTTESVVIKKCYVEKMLLRFYF